MPTENLELPIADDPTNADDAAPIEPARPESDAPLSDDEGAALLREWRTASTPAEAADAAGLSERDSWIIRDYLADNSSDEPQTCDCCEETYHPQRMGFTQVIVRRYVTEMHCDDCYQSGDYITADDTGDVYSDEYGRDRLYWNENAEVWTVSEPEPEDSDDGECLHSYGLRVDQHHGWPAETPQDSLCFGVELECEAKRGYSQSDLCAALGGKDGNGTYILKDDGSLSNGAELVTLPYSLEHHREKFGWSRILDSEVARIGKSGTGTNACGIHVHVNRRALSPLTIGKMIVFLNNADNGDLVTTIAQRASNGYCSRDVNKKLTDIHCGNRYDLLNVSGRNTVEFRLFKGNLRPERVLKNLEFCHALVRFCEQNGIKASSRGSKFLQWISSRDATYPNLHKFLAERGLIASPVSLSELIGPAVEPVSDL